MKRLVFVVTILLAFTAANAQYKLTPLDCPGSTVSFLTGINNHGLSVGAVDSQTDPVMHAMVFSRGKCIPLAPETVLGKKFSIAMGVNDRGDIVGVYFDDSGYQHGFMVDKHGTFSALDFPAANDTWPAAINESGKVVGYWQIRDAQGNVLSLRGFTWETGNFSEIMVPGSANTYVGGINARGDIGGFWDTGTIAGHPFVYTKETYSSFDVPCPDAVGAQVNSINAKGQMAGVCWDANGGSQVGFLKLGTKSITLIYPGAPATALWGINNTGEITGWYFDSSFNPHAYYGMIKP